MEQFNNENEKAELNSNSQYFKRLLMNQEYVLSVMIYCNFHVLQYELSKTYRENNGAKHTYFYHLGKYLKISVHQFGREMMEGQSLYHGLAERLYFPNYIAQCKLESGIAVCCPLSTSSSFAVALNFSNQGLIVHFIKCGFSKVKYFQCSLLSDYSYEREYLFIQNRMPGFGALEIYNIYDLSEGHQYRAIFDGLTTVQRAVHISDMGSAMHLLGRTAAISALRIPDFNQRITVKILCDRLSSMYDSYDPFESLNAYAKQVIATYFESRTKILLNPPQFSHEIFPEIYPTFSFLHD
eukprot:947810_1